MTSFQLWHFVFFNLNNLHFIVSLVWNKFTWLHTQFSFKSAHMLIIAFTWLVNITITNFPPLPQYSYIFYNSPNLLFLLPKSSQGSLGPTVLLSLLFPVKYGLSNWYDSTPEKSCHKRDSNPGSSTLEADTLTTRPTRRSAKHIRTENFWPAVHKCMRY